MGTSRSARSRSRSWRRRWSIESRTQLDAWQRAVLDRLTPPDSRVRASTASVMPRYTPRSENSPREGRNLETLSHRRCHYRNVRTRVRSERLGCPRTNRDLSGHRQWDFALAPFLRDVPQRRRGLLQTEKITRMAARSIVGFNTSNYCGGLAVPKLTAPSHPVSSCNSGNASFPAGTVIPLTRGRVVRQECQRADRSEWAQPAVVRFKGQLGSEHQQVQGLYHDQHALRQLQHGPEVLAHEEGLRQLSRRYREEPCAVSAAI